MGNYAVDLLQRQIQECQFEVEDLKIKIADCAIKAHSKEFKPIQLILDNLHQMSELIAEVKPKEATLDGLFKVKMKLEDELELEKACANDE